LARVLIIEGGDRALRLAELLVEEGHAVRLTTDDEDRREAITDLGAECWIGTPARLATLRAAIENVSVVCWLLAEMPADNGQLSDLHTSRLEFFLGQIIDSTVRGFVYETLGTTVPTELRERSTAIAQDICMRNLIPLQIVDADPSAQEWLESARGAIASVLGAGR
jgi:hypothetical protein